MIDLTTTHNRRLLTAFLLGSSLVLSGCSSTSNEAGAKNPRPVRSLPGEDITRDIYKARGAAISARNEFRGEMEKYRTEQAAFDSTLLGTAVAAVISAFTGGSGTTVGAIGLGGAGIGAYRGYYDPEKRASAHMKAIHALNCVIDESQVLFSLHPPTKESEPKPDRGPDPQMSEEKKETSKESDSDREREKRERLEQQAEQNATRGLRSASTTLSAAIATFRNSTASAKPTGNAAVTLAQTQARNSAMDAANQTKAVIDGELSAYLQAPTFIWKAVNHVIAYVDSQTARQAPDTGSVRTNLLDAARAQSETITAARLARTQLNNARQAHSAAIAQNAVAKLSEDDDGGADDGGAADADKLNMETQIQMNSSLPSLSYAEVDLRIAACVANM